jgi:dethiobiotin synthetase
VIVEGVGGWLVPVERELTMADLAVEFDLPVLIVAANQLGALNHTLLTVHAVKAAKLACAGVLLNEARPPAPDDAATLTNRPVLEQLLDLPVVEIAHGADGAEALQRLPAIAALLAGKTP